MCGTLRNRKKGRKPWVAMGKADTSHVDDRSSACLWGLLRLSGAFEPAMNPFGGVGVGIDFRTIASVRFRGGNAGDFNGVDGVAGSVEVAGCWFGGTGLLGVCESPVVVEAD